MNMARSDGYSAVAAVPMPVGRGLIRWAVFVTAGVIALILALSHSMAAGAAAPIAYDTNCVAINYTTCIPTVGYVAPANGYIAPGYGVFNGNVVSVTPDARYCGGIVYVVNEGGNLIDRCPNGARVFPAFADYGTGFIGGNYINGYFNNGFVGNGVLGNAALCGGVYGCSGAFNNFAGCNININCGAFPAGATYVGGGIYTYRDNRFCGDGNLAFVVGRGSYCQNGQPLFANGNVVVNPGFYRFFEAAPAAPAAQAPAAIAQPVTAPAAAPVVAAPVAAPVAPVAAPAVVQQAPAAAPVVSMPTALTAPQVQTPDAAPAGGSTVHVLSAPAVTAPAATRDLDDHR